MLGSVSFAVVSVNSTAFFTACSNQLIKRLKDAWKVERDATVYSTSSHYHNKTKFVFSW